MANMFGGFLNVNTIEWNGEKVVINSYSDHPLMVKSMNEQREWFAARYPFAVVKTERMTETDTIAMVSRKRFEQMSYALEAARKELGIV